MHGTTGFPAKRTWIKSIKANNFVGFPGLHHKYIPKLINKLAKCEYTAKGHMKLIPKNLRTTKPPIEEEEDEDEPMLPPQDNPSESHEYGAILMGTKDLTKGLTPIQQKRVLSWDLPGRFPVTSARGHNYIFVLYDYDTNYIRAVPIKSREKTVLLKSLKDSFDMFRRKGIRPKLVKMDNEVSKKMKHRNKSLGN